MLPHLPELHGAATHLAVIAIPLYALLLVLRRLGRAGAASTAWEPWVLGAAVFGVLSSGVTGLLVRGQSLTELRGSDYDVGGVHFWLGIALALLVVVPAGQRLLAHRRGRGWSPSVAWLGVAGVALAAVFIQGYLGGRMTYEHGVGVQALGEGRQTAVAASTLHLALASGTPMTAAGAQAFDRTGLGCGSCHGDRAQGARGPRLAGGQSLGDFRRAHADGLFPPAAVSDRDFAAIDAWLRTLPH